MRVPDPFIGPLLRAARRSADLSQRELARAAGFAASAVGAYESAARDVPFSVLVRLLHVCSWAVVAVDRRGTVVEVFAEPPTVDRGGRRYPAHLDLRELDPDYAPGRWPFDDWWGDRTPSAWGLPPRPDRTFDLDRERRMRRRDALATGDPAGWPRPRRRWLVVHPARRRGTVARPGLWSR